MPKNIDPGQRAQKKDARKGAAFFALVQLAMALLLLWGFSIDAEDAPPLPLLVVLVAIPGVVILGVLLAMIQRFREIEKGEAEDAKQY